MEFASGFHACIIISSPYYNIAGTSKPEQIEDAKYEPVQARPGTDQQKEPKSSYEGLDNTRYTDILGPSRILRFCTGRIFRRICLPAQN